MTVREDGRMASLRLVVAIDGDVHLVAITNDVRPLPPDHYDTAEQRTH